MTEEQIKLVNILDTFFQPAISAEVPCMYTTMEIFSKLQSLYPSDKYEPSDVYEVLVYKQCATVNSTDSKIYWLLQEVER